ncbi:hypothetical protein [Chitinophaga polysaccharea]|uniref:hypothetical protein n=1 Tax=Chitinophaga polysaccharea TaxID=1293035 RepID=UPI0011590A06|nr:hypothetical protein [Chitinophaga polysaccharea]
MIKIPELTSEQVAVLKVDGNTGHVLNINDKVFHKDSNDEVYLVFEDIIAAKKYIVELQQVNDEIEFTIYGSDKSVIEFIPAIKWGS